MEDETLIAILLEDYLSDIGYMVRWHADNIKEALEIIESNAEIDGAILDVNIRGEPVRPIADALKSKGVPFCFMTGYGSAANTGHPDAPVIGKPFDMSALQQTVRGLVGQRSQAQGGGR